MSQTASPHAVSLQQTLKSVETSLQSFGSGPYTPEQTDKIRELNQLKQNLLGQIQATGTTASYALQSQPTPVMNPSSAVNLNPVGMVNLNSVKIEPQPVAVQGAAAASTSDDKILSRQRLQELVKEIDPNGQLDDDVEEMLMQITDDFIESVVGAACDIAKHRNATVLEVKDLKLHLENHWNITIPGYGSDEIKPYKKPLITEAHKQRMTLIRKATKK